jgi:hypothetical protein
MILDCDTEGELNMRRFKLEIVVLLAGATLALSSCHGSARAVHSLSQAFNNVHIGFGSTTGRLKETTETRALTINDWQKLNVSNEVGEIRVVAGSEKPSLRITKRFYQPENLKFSLETRGDTLLVKGLVKANLCNNCGIDLTFNIPAGLEVQLQSDVGEVAATGQMRSLEIKTEVGAIHAHHLGESSANLHSDTGDIRLDHTRGEVKLETSIGEIVVSDVQGSLNLTTDTGNVTAKNISLEPDSRNFMTSNVGMLKLEEFTSPGGLQLEGQTSIGDLELGLNGFSVHQSGELTEHQFSASRVGTRPAMVKLQTDTGLIVARAN